MFASDDVIEMAREELALILRGREIIEVVTVVIVVARNAVGDAPAAGGQLIDLREHAEQQRIRRSDETLTTIRIGLKSFIVEVDFLNRAGRVLVGKDAVEGVRRGSGHRRAEQSHARKALGQSEAFIVDEEEELVLDDRSSQSSAVLIEQDAFAIQPVEVVEIVVGIERRVSMLPESASMKFIGAGFCDELDLHRAFAAAFGARSRG